MRHVAAFAAQSRRAALGLTAASTKDELATRGDVASAAGLAGNTAPTPTTVLGTIRFIGSIRDGSGSAQGLLRSVTGVVNVTLKNLFTLLEARLKAGFSGIGDTGSRVS